jgi:hypothetical protein
VCAPGVLQLFAWSGLVEKLFEAQRELVQAGLHVTAHPPVGVGAPVLREQMAILAHDRLELFPRDEGW